ncbi:helix-turn-helix domain-containing protein [Rhizobium ruizarguesonis]|uniref:helix-turn-helix domain-containing protein n=1 Tax=Rhizobium ruizarguesonis TaxID=2081791 RepID=UPI001030CE63|nr:helix-turn-helix domain-containing protein [Rhizobium ruizarguesonis]TAY80974.1 DNA-binding protein [Rhizobium ruizarguesonis]
MMMKQKRPCNDAIQTSLLVLVRKLSDVLGVPISLQIGDPAFNIAQALVPARKAAEYLGVSQKTLANWRCSGTRGLQYVQVGSRILYRQNDLDDFILNSRKSSTSEKPAGRHG